MSFFETHKYIDTWFLSVKRSKLVLLKEKTMCLLISQKSKSGNLE